MGAFGAMVSCLAVSAVATLVSRAGVSREWREVAAVLNPSSFPARDDTCILLRE